MSRPRFERFLRNLAHWCTYCDKYTSVTTYTTLYKYCPGVDIALEEGFDQAGKAGFGVLHASQLVGHAARLLYLFIKIVQKVQKNWKRHITITINK